MYSNPISVLREPSRCKSLFTLDGSVVSFLCLFTLDDFCFCVNIHAILSITPSRLVGGSGDIKLTKDGNTLLKEMVSPIKNKK